MLGNRYLKQADDAFARQFEPEGDGFIYRQSMREAGVRVTAQERDTFSRAFVKSVRWLSWGLVGAIILFAIGFVGLSEALGEEPSDHFLYGGTLLLVGGFVLGYVRAWQMPARTLERRPRLGEPRSRAEVRRIMLANMGWGQVAAGGALALFLLANVDLDKPFADVSNLLWAAGAAIMTGVTIYNATRKLRGS